MMSGLPGAAAEAHSPQKCKSHQARAAKTQARRVSGVNRADIRSGKGGGQADTRIHGRALTSMRFWASCRPPHLSQKNLSLRSSICADWVGCAIS